MSQMHCPNCNKLIEDDSQYCSHCGVRISHKNVKIRCPRCQNEVDDQSRFCPYCGNEIHRKKAPKSPVESPSQSLIQCPNWKRDVTPSTDECFYCGHILTTSKQIEFVKVSETLSKIVLTPQIAGHNLKNKLGLIKFGNNDNRKTKIYT